MPITFYEEQRIFKLDTKDSSYVISIYDEGYLLGLYYGKKIPDVPFDGHENRGLFASFSPMNEKLQDKHFSPDVQPVEYSGIGTGDFRKPAVVIRNADGNTCTDFRYVSHKIYSGKSELPGLPSTFSKEDGDCSTLEIETEDKTTGVRANLCYTVFEDHSVMARSVKIVNGSGKNVDIEKAYSASLQLPDMDFDMIHLYGNWYEERMYARTALDHGTFSISSSRGASSHFHNPAAILARKNATEDTGEAYGVNLVYSGSFDISADCDYYETTRLNIGIDPDTFKWHLTPGESFRTPEALTVYSDEGIGGVSRIYHRFFRDHLIPPKFVNEKRPLLINSWEAAYMNINTDILVSFAERAKELGIEMLVMDDGWFGKRNNDLSSLGDWYVNEEKFPGGLSELIGKINDLGIKFGIWYEPEMISPISDIFEKHPDWALGVPGRDRSIARHQYVIDMTRSDVRDAIYSQMYDVLSKYNIEYLKWDFNRNITEAGSALLPYENGGEVMHRFILGTYDLLSRLRRDFPDLLIESCSGGGGRFDAGMLYYSPQIWTSDNTNPIQRIDIQFGTSLFYPASTMGAHVSMNPRDNFPTKGNVALWGTFGYELDPNLLTDEEKETVKVQIKEYHETYGLIRNGDLYRIICPWDNDYRAAWEIVSGDKNEVLFTHVTMRYFRLWKHIVKLRGLDPDKVYRDLETGKKYSGAFLMNAGLNLTDYPRGNGDSFKIHLKAE